ncbi:MULTISPECIES: acyltransferase family protein [unclassified Aminobacter]|uniref:acyltransferase family protein n=1 Tax=unclassified Aminobacter TaxID=2644704 RepID=UPI0009FC4D24|nr:MULTISPECIES: acyltransferase family protein [unclassified Aminobacter]TWH36649.1 peptidoglycan/LPS O-acetylase OafA/YrhL [Aminobacter sp. J15]
MNKTTYLRFVDGLRAIAVLSVVAFHMELNSPSGGYTGVDIFFIISGFLIIRQIVSGVETGSFSFSDFWSRRALRILPPYFLVIFASVLLSTYVLIIPAEIRQFGQEVLYSAGMVANHLFLSQQGYFDRDSSQKILLHLWSLAVEEQFYLVTPLLLVGLFKLRLAGKTIAMIVAALAVASFVGCIYWTGTGLDKNYAFYLMPLRAWEFAAGGAIPFAVPYLKRLSRPAVEAVAALGVLLLAYAIFRFDETTPFPSFWAAIPVCGTAMIIGAGLARPDILTARALATTPMVWIGLISYAWYLWHWPLMAMARIINYGTLSPKWAALAAVVSFCLAVATHLWVEKPILAWRRKRGSLPLGWRPAIAGVGACILPALLGGAYAYVMPQRATDANSFLASAEEKARAPIHCVIGRPEHFAGCASIDPERSRVLVMGDSHAGQALDVLGHHLEDSAIVALAVANCPAIFDVRVIGFSPESEAECVAAKQRGLEAMMSEVRPDAALLISIWTIYGKWAGEPQPGEFGRFLAEVDANRPEPQQGRFYSRKLSETISKLHSLGVDRVAIVAPVPEMPKPSPECVARAVQAHVDVDARCSVTRENAEKRREASMQVLHEVLAEHPNVRLIDPFPSLCDDTWCRPYRGSQMLYLDQNHLLHPAVSSIIEDNRDIFNWIEGKSPTVLSQKQD